ncbi:uncharacterized protein LOC126267956 [Schistocerca gregaria]|uniref:uncharacterized protein LOC126267956 n=1 Tax=Schistocerca gregaria TaxID=7010 RepID=UPI00211E2192|nr:uncharacterized protein LOC126267956 [Schistocerca gregaria]
MQVQMKGQLPVNSFNFIFFSIVIQSVVEALKENYRLKMEKSALIALVRSERAIWDQCDKQCNNCDPKPILLENIGNNVSDNFSSCQRGSVHLLVNSEKNIRAFVLEKFNGKQNVWFVAQGPMYL